MTEGYKMNEKKEYTVKRFSSVDSIDWNGVPKASIDTFKWTDSVPYTSFARLVYVEDVGLICRMDASERDPASVCTEADGPVCLDSCMEFFISLDGENYLNLETNAIGTKCMGFGPGRHGRIRVKERLPGGFDAIPEVTEYGWSITYTLPLSDLALFWPEIGPESFASGTRFTANFYKTGSREVTGVEHYGMWNEVFTENPDFHRPEYFGSLIMA